MNQPVPLSGARFASAVQRFDETNRLDPNREIDNGISQPREWLYTQRLAAWVLRLDPNASKALQLASRCQHICRWMIPRASYPMTKPGYLKWRNDLKHFHAQKAGEILREVGYDDEMIMRVQALNLKKNFPADSESRVLEDALCLVFLEFQFADLVAKTAEDKIINAVQKTWKKMTPAAHALAQQLPLGDHEKQLITRALQSRCD